VPAEVKHARLSKIEIPRSFRSFLAKYQPAKGYGVQAGNKEEQEKVDETEVLLFPYFKLLLQGIDPT